MEFSEEYFVIFVRVVQGVESSRLRWQIGPESSGGNFSTFVCLVDNRVRAAWVETASFKFTDDAEL